MTSVQFINYTPTPGEKHMGIATIKLYNRIVLRYKIVPNKDGSGYFPTSASYKIVDEQGERYVSAFVIDSNSEKEEIEGIIRANVKKAIAQPSVFSQPVAQSPMQQNPNYMENTQPQWNPNPVRQPPIQPDSNFRTSASEFPSDQNLPF